MASLMTSAPRSTVRTSLSDPPKLPTAVLAPLTMTHISHLNTVSFLQAYTRISIASPWAAPEQMPQTPRPPPRLLSS